MKIKVCGLKYAENIDAVTALQPDYEGFVCYAPSPRYAGELDADIMENIPDTIIKTAVFVNEDRETISALIGKYGFDAIQLHGSEDAEFCAYFKDKVQVIRAFGLHQGFDFSVLDDFSDAVDLFLFDTKTAIHGGSGKTFDWSLLNRYQLDVPFFLSGGLSLDNLEEIKAIDHPQLYGVDLNSKFETSHGMKDIAKLEKAFDIIKQTTNEIRG
ncbi:MAG TPA: phosphoribosylanthranilate isomerase [Mucilaginibacter sp.]|jgi:phosphoribosylanthranilate isomerase|nr:phosphoribosylanthranilate isomerase [Mucilaginibacter sp.]